MGEFAAKETYDAASRDNEDASSEFWQYLSRRTLARLGLEPGERVLRFAEERGMNEVVRQAHYALAHKPA